MPNLLFQLATVATLAGTPAMGPDGPDRPVPVTLPTPDIVRYSGTSAEIEVATPAVAKAEIDIDGRIDDLAWSGAALLTDFTQYDPLEGLPASQQTEVLVLVDAEAIYFAIRAFDENPEQIRATLTERDSFTFTDDYVRIVLDTYADQRRAYVFTVNPLGVQHDGLWNEGGSSGRRGGFGPPIDDSPDFLWDSNGGVTEDGYQVEVRIPFKSLRFQESQEQSWGLQLERNIQRNGYRSSWAPKTEDIANQLAQTGRLNDLRNLDMGLFMELNPVATGAVNGEVDDLGVFGHDAPTGEFGFNATYGVTSNLTLDATFNPDFSQIEADAGQIQVNERFALFFPERRPFFLEGTEIFGMPKQLVYTRSIENPIAGGKLTGKVGGLSLGYLGAVDETFATDASNVYVNLVRARADVGGSSSVGAVYTDRTVAAADFNRVVGADARLQFGGRYTLTLMSAQSFTNHDFTDGRTDGRMMSARFERAGRSFSFNAEFEDTEPDFEPGSGFFRRLGTAEANAQLQYNWFGGRGALLQSIGPSIQVRSYWDHDQLWAGQGIEEAEVQLSSRFGFKDNITFWGNVQFRRFQYQPEQYEGLFVAQADGSFTPFRPDQENFSRLPSITTGLWVNKWQRVRGNMRFTWSDSPIFDRSFGVAVENARSFSGNASLNLYPTRAFVAEIGVNYSRLTRKADGAEYSEAIIPRLRGQYQFSRALFFRSIVEYGSQTRMDLRDPVTGLALARCTTSGCSPRAGSEGHDFRVEGLVGYEPSPGTVFFFGYTREMEDATAFGFENVRPTRDGLFVKLSYRFRM